VNRFSSRWGLLVWGLAGYFLLLSGLVIPQTVSHATHHAHHQAATHADVLCSWLCAAGQDIETTTVSGGWAFRPIGALETHAPPSLPNLVSLDQTSRGPPAGSFS
jgi:hypothetical protein